MNRFISLVFGAVLLPILSTAQEVRYDNTPISEFDLSRYLGTWYEIARFDHGFERGMDNVVADYLLREDGKVEVINSGWKNGKFITAEGVAKQPEPYWDPAHLKVSFFMFFYNDYNVLMLDDDYQVALVGSKSPKYLWILSRTPYLEDYIIDMIVEEAEYRGYDTENLIWVDQASNIDTFWTL